MLNPNSEGVSLFRLRWIGYALLLFTALESFDNLFPLQLMNAAWERQTIGVLVERTPLLLMGLGLVLNGESYRRKKLELLVLKLISWICLLLSIAFFLMIPLGLISSFRVYNDSQRFINTDLQQKLSQIRLSEEQLRSASDQELRNFAKQIQQRALQNGQPAPAIEAQDPAAFRRQLLSQLKTSKAQIEKQSSDFRGAQQRTLIKDGFKWSLGAFIVSILSFMFWQSSAWARKAKPGITAKSALKSTQEASTAQDSSQEG
jgi:hypothetical protein